MIVFSPGFNRVFFWRFGKPALGPFDELKGIDWEWLSLARAMTKAPLGGKKPGQNPTDRGESGVKRSLSTQGDGALISVVVDGANRHDTKPTELIPKRHCRRVPRTDRRKAAGDVS
jgi:hypothetical protein